MPSNRLLQTPTALPEGFVSLLPAKIPPVKSKAEQYCWVYHPDYGFYFIEGDESYHYRFFSGSGKGNSRTEVIPNKLYDDCNRGYAWIDRKKKEVQIQVSPIIIRYNPYLDFVPKQVVKGFQKAFPKYHVFVKGSHMASKTAEYDEAYEAQVCDATGEAASNIIYEYKKHVKDKGYHQDWDLVPFPRLKKIWEDYMKTGFVRDEAGLNRIAEILVYNVAAIQVNTTLCGHSSNDPERWAEDEVGEAFPEGFFEINDTFFEDEKGSWRISDYAMDELTHLACEIRRAAKAEQKLQVIDQLLNVVHQRSDLAGWFVQGGSRSLSQLSQTLPLPEPEPKKKKAPVNKNQYRFPFASSFLAPKVALDALLEMYNDEDYATHQHHSDPDFTTQNGKMMGKGREVEEGALNDAVPGRLLGSKHASSAALPPGYQPNPTLTDDMFKWVWSPSHGPVIFNDKFLSLPYGMKRGLHADVIYLNHMDYDETPKGFIDAYPGRKAFRVWTVGGFNNSAELSNAMDAVAEEFQDMYGLKDWTIEIPPNYGYKGIYQQPKVEDEDGEEGIAQFASDVKMTNKTQKCAACESGDCFAHQATVGAMPIKVLTDQVVPAESEPTVEDATFFKESDEFEVSHNANGDVIIAATQSYGTGTPVGGTSNIPAPPVQQVQPTPITTAPPQQVQQKQPQQPTTAPLPPNGPPPPNTPPSTTSTTQQQIQEEQMTTASANRIKLKLTCRVEKEFAPAVGTVVKACTDALEISGYKVSTASHKLSSDGHGEALIVTVERKKAGATIDPKDVVARVSHAVNPDYFVNAFKSAAVPIKETPTSLPPRDDMRRHIDETAQAEVMEGIHTPTAPTPTTTQQQQPVPQPQPPMTNQQKLQQQALASDEKVAWEEEDDDDDGPDGAYGTLYGKPLGGNSESASTPQDRLEYLRGELRGERISQGELLELQGLVDYIEPDDVELLEAAGVPEEEAMAMQERMRTPTPAKPKKRFRTTDKDKKWLQEMGIKASIQGVLPRAAAASTARDKVAIQIEEGVNQICPNCHGQEVKNVEDSPQEDGIVECVDCGCFFSL